MISFQEFKQQSQAGKGDKIRSAGLVYRLQRRLSVRLSWLIAKWLPGFRPNQLSAMNVVLVVLTVLLSLRQPVVASFAVGQLILLWFSSVLDKMDGELARFRHHFSQAGIYYDLLYHFLYPLAFYVIVGLYFSGLFGSPVLAILSFAVGMLASLYKMIGKLRHHIRFKIKLENHASAIADYRPINQNLPNLSFSQKVVEQTTLMIYGAVWVWYVALVIFSTIDALLAGTLFFLHLLVTFVVLLWRLLWTIPRYRLFTRAELES